MPAAQDALRDFQDNIRTVLAKEREWKRRIDSAETVNCLAMHGIAGLALVGERIGVFVPEVEIPVRVAGWAAWAGVPIGSLAAAAMRNRLAPLITFRERARKMLDAHA